MTRAVKSDPRILYSCFLVDPSVGDLFHCTVLATLPHVRSPAATKAQVGQYRTYSTTSASSAGALLVPCPEGHSCEQAERRRIRHPCRRRHGPALTPGGNLTLPRQSRSQGNQVHGEGVSEHHAFRTEAYKFQQDERHQQNADGTRSDKPADHGDGSQQDCPYAARKPICRATLTQAAEVSPDTSSETVTAGSPCMFALGPKPFSLPA